MATVVSVLLCITAPYYSFGHCSVCSSLSYSSLLLFWPLHCLFFFELQLLITLLATVVSVLLWVTAPYYSFGHCSVCSSLSYSSLSLFWPLYCLFFFELQLLITLLVTVLSVLLSYSSLLLFWPLYCLFFWVTAPYYSFGHCIVCSSLSYSSLSLFWSLYCLFFFELQLLITLFILVYWNFS